MMLVLLKKILYRKSYCFPVGLCFRHAKIHHESAGELLLFNNGKLNITIFTRSVMQGWGLVSFNLYLELDADLPFFWLLLNRLLGILLVFGCYTLSPNQPVRVSPFGGWDNQIYWPLLCVRALSSFLAIWLEFWSGSHTWSLGNTPAVSGHFHAPLHCHVNDFHGLFTDLALKHEKRMLGQQEVPNIYFW